MTAIFADNSIKDIYRMKTLFLLNEISLKYIPQGLIKNKSVLFHVMAWCCIGDRPWFEPMMIYWTCIWSSLGHKLHLHMSITQSQWVNNSGSTLLVDFKLEKVTDKIQQHANSYFIINLWPCAYHKLPVHVHWVGGDRNVCNIAE